MRWNYSLFPQTEATNPQIQNVHIVRYPPLEMKEQGRICTPSLRSQNCQKPVAIARYLISRVDITKDRVHIFYRTCDTSSEAVQFLVARSVLPVRQKNSRRCANFVVRTVLQCALHYTILHTAPPPTEVCTTAMYYVGDASVSNATALKSRQKSPSVASAADVPSLFAKRSALLRTKTTLTRSVYCSFELA